jgi:hypothetical protein
VSRDTIEVLCERPFDLNLSFAQLEGAVESAVSGELAVGFCRLGKTRHLEIREWFISTAQVAGARRHTALGEPDTEMPEVPKAAQDTPRISVPLARSVLERDGYRCRYCNIPIIYTNEARKLRALFGAKNFQMSKSNRMAHGTLRAFYNSFDHVVPLSRGGRTCLDNLVTACYPCNFGKDNFTLSQLRLQSPFSRVPQKTDHDGFITLLRRK